MKMLNKGRIYKELRISKWRTRLAYFKNTDISTKLDILKYKDRNSYQPFCKRSFSRKLVFTKVTRLFHQWAIKIICLLIASPKWQDGFQKKNNLLFFHLSEINFLACTGSVLGLVSYNTRKSGIHLCV